MGQLLGTLQQSGARVDPASGHCQCHPDQGPLLSRRQNAILPRGKMPWPDTGSAALGGPGREKAVGVGVWGPGGRWGLFKYSLRLRGDQGTGRQQTQAISTLVPQDEWLPALRGSEGSPQAMNDERSSRAPPQEGT